MGRWNTENPDVKNILSRQASGAIVADRFVKDIAGGLVAQCGAGEQAHGVARSAAATGTAVAVQYIGDLHVEAGAAIADRAEVMSDSVGRAVVATTGLIINGDVTNGSSAGAAGDIITVHMRPLGTVAKPA